MPDLSVCAIRPGYLILGSANRFSAPRYGSWPAPDQFCTTGGGLTAYFLGPRPIRSPPSAAASLSRFSAGARSLLATHVLVALAVSPHLPDAGDSSMLITTARARGRAGRSRGCARRRRGRRP